MMTRKKAAPPKPRRAGQQPDPDKLKRVLRDAELKKFDPELQKLIPRRRRK
jgi:hypothetical protein